LATESSRPVPLVGAAADGPRASGADRPPAPIGRAGTPTHETKMKQNETKTKQKRNKNETKMKQNETKMKQK
jgi:hypothetical protein